MKTLKLKLLQVISLVLLCACNPMGDKLKVEFKDPTAFKDLKTQVSSVSVVNDQLIISGSTLEAIKTITLKNGSEEEVFDVESATDSQIVANSRRALGIIAGSVFDLILSDAYGSATYQVTFTVSDGSITTSKIANGAVSAAKLSSMGATTGQVLKYNGTAWVPSSITNAQIYLGTWNATTNVPDLSNPSATPGDYFIVSVAGTFGGVSYSPGDWIISDGYNWQKVANSQSVVSSFNGRRGLVTLVPGDYVSLKDGSTGKITGSSINDLADIDLAGLAANKILKYNGTKWIVADDNAGASGGAGSVGTTELQDTSVTYGKTNFSDGDIPQAKVNGLVSALSGKEPTIIAGTTAQFYRGDKSWQTLDTSIVPENSNLYFTNARAIAAPLTGIDITQTTAVAAADSILVGLGKMQGQINAKASSASIVDWSVAGTPYIYPTRIYGGAVQANKTLVTDGLGDVTTSSVTPTELGYLAGVTSAIQTQINNLANSASPTFTGTPLSPTAAVNTNTTQIATTAFVLGQAATANPTMNGAVAVGTSYLFARQDHVHPTDTSRSPLAGSTSITTLGTVTSGTWNAGTLAIQYGGTGATSAADARTSLGLGTSSTYATGTTANTIPLIGTGGIVANNLCAADSSGGGVSCSVANTSAGLAGLISDETGSGALVYATTPTISGYYETAAAEVSGSNYTVPNTTKNVIQYKLTGNSTITLPTAPVTSNTVYNLTIKITQDAAGGRTLAFAAPAGDTIAWDSSATMPAVHASANKRTIYQFVKIQGDTTWYGGLVWKEN